MLSSLIYLISFLSLIFMATDTQALSLCGKLQQGELLIGHGALSKTVTLDGKTYPVNDHGDFLLVLERDCPGTVTLNADGKDYLLKVAKQDWDIQSIKGVEQRKVTPLNEDEAEILREQKDVKEALTTVDNVNQAWQNGFVLPLSGRISGNFGNQRIFNGIPKSPHTGTDIAAPEGSEVKSAGDGKVLLSGGNYFYGGNMVIIDHGLGLQTIYMHLQKATVKKGDEIKKGDVVGLVGKTGRATGPHLHWGASFNNIRFRPHSLLEPKQCIILENKD